MVYVFVSTAALMLFFYYADANREPPKRVIEAFLLGIVVSLQINYLQQAIPLSGIIFVAFVSAGLFEEFVKLLALRLTLFRNPCFTKSVDGITYAVFLSLGFATAENIILVTTLEIGIIRAFTAVPAHALFAVSMGYWLGRYRFSGDRKHFLLALAVPVILHGFYNMLILSGQVWGIVLFIPYMTFLWWLGMLKHTKLNEKVKKIAGKNV